MRKDFEVPPSTDDMLSTMLASITALEKQVANLSEQLKQHTLPHPPPPPLISNQQQPPQRISFPDPSEIENNFLSALAKQSTSATVRLIDDHMALFDLCLPPMPDGRSPLSQAVLLTLLHRVGLN